MDSKSIMHGTETQIEQTDAVVYGLKTQTERDSRPAGNSQHLTYTCVSVISISVPTYHYMECIHLTRV